MAFFTAKLTRESAGNTTRVQLPNDQKTFRDAEFIRFPTEEELKSSGVLANHVLVKDGEDANPTWWLIDTNESK